MYIRSWLNFVTRVVVHAYKLLYRQYVNIWSRTKEFQSQISHTRSTWYRARLEAWGMLISPLCPLCACHDETRDHLFLSCQFSREIWKEVFTRCRSHTAVITNWSELLSWIRTATSTRRVLLRKIATQSIVYHIWRQRNNLVHNQAVIPAATVFRTIDNEIRNIISARRLRKNYSSLMSLWLS